MSRRRCSVEDMIGRCIRRTCSSRHEGFCVLERTVGECTIKPCNSRHIGSCLFENSVGFCPRESCYGNHVKYCSIEERYGECTQKPCNSKHRVADAQPKTPLPPICKSWQDGNCFAWGAAECSRRHYYTDDDEILPQSRRFLDENDEGSSVHTMTHFSSPYSVCIKKEIVKKRNVEVDLETGRKKSWVETMEQEIVDLTGETSAKKPIRSPMMDRTNLLNVQVQPCNHSTSRSRNR